MKTEKQAAELAEKWITGKVERASVLDAIHDLPFNEALAVVAAIERNLIEGVSINDDFGFLKRLQKECG